MNPFDLTKDMVDPTDEPYDEGPEALPVECSLSESQSSVDAAEYVVPAVMYDGADNTSEVIFTQAATSDVLPSPQVCSASSAPDPTNQGAFKAFDKVDLGNSPEYQTGWQSGYGLPQSIMIDVGSGNGVLVNKYKILGSIRQSTDNFKSWLLQGSNDASATVNDAVDSAKWTTLDTRTSATTSLGTWLTFLNDTSYEKYRVWVTVRQNAGDYPTGTAEIYLIQQAVA